VAFDVPGIREIVVHGENGFLIPPGDEHALVESLRRLIGDAELRKRMGARSRRHFETEYDLETVFSKTLDVYRICLQSD
jgi:glycosyltransferase involved in cell wall biosynthesis